MHLIKFTRFGDNFNYRRTIGIQWPFYQTVLPCPLKEQNTIHKLKWKITLLPKEL